MWDHVLPVGFFRCFLLSFLPVVPPHSENGQVFFMPLFASGVPLVCFIFFFFFFFVFCFFFFPPFFS